VYSSGNRSASFKTARDFWKNDSGQGIAQYTNRNFVTIGTNFSACTTSPGYCAISGFPDPAAGDTRLEEVSIRLSIVEALERFVLFQPDQQPSAERISAESLFVGASGPIESFTLVEENYAAVSNVVVPRAIGYSAGLLNFFFRGALAATVEFPGQVISGKVIIRNLTPEALDGFFALYVDTADTGQRTNVMTLPCTIGPAETCKLAEIPAGGRNPIVVFRGRSGQDADLVIGMAVQQSAVAVERQPSPTQVKDIWTTSVISYVPGVGGGPGGGLNDEWLKVGGWGDTYVSLMQFDLTGLPVQASKATVELFLPQASGAGVTSINVYRTVEYWDWKTQGTGTDHERLWWADKPKGELIAPGLPPPQVGKWYSIDITGLYNSWQDGTPNYGIQLWPTRTDNYWASFYSSDFVGDPALRPKLVVIPK